MTFILYSRDADAAVPLWGGKAKALAALGQKNLAIPDWFVLAPAAFDCSLTEAERQLLTLQPLTSAKISTILEQVQLSQAVQAQLSAALAVLCPTGERVAVRSSASDEDGALHSFAGQLDSFLFVPVEEVAEKVIAVWKSAFSDRVLTYRREHGLPLPTSPAVLIQKMVDAEAAGVAFSANPVTGQRSVAVVSAVYGLGTSLVAGECDADTYQVDRAEQILVRQVAEKQVAHHYDPAQADRIAVLPVAPELINQPVLRDQQIQAVAALVRQVEQHFGRPQDIEWAIAQGKLYLLQARPITALAQRPDPDGVLNLWDNSNIAESYGGITTPLTFSFARRVYEEVYRQFCRIMAVSEQAIDRHDSTFRCMLGLMQGRIYYNLLNWYRVLALLPGFTVNRRFMEQMMGVREELPADVLAELAGASWRDRLRDGFRLTNTLVGLLKNYLTLPQQIKQFYQRLDRALALPQSKLEEMRPDELVAYYHDLERQLLTRWDAPLVNDFFAMIFYGVLRKLAANWCGDAAGTLQNDLISGEGGMISAEPAQRVRHLAQTAARHPTFVKLLCEGSLAQILPEIPQFSEFQSQYQDYLDRFGDRCLEELKLESATLHDDPLLLLRSIGQLALQQSDVGRSPEVQMRATRQLTDSPTLRQQAETRANQFLSGHPLRRLIFQQVLKNTRARVRDRENLRFERTRLFGRVRRIFVELGKRFYALDLITSPRDIFYLELNEILGIVEGTATCTHLKALVAIRQTEFEAYRDLPAPGDRFQTHGTVHPLIPSASQSTKPQPQFATSNSLQGTGCCPGVIRAPVQVIMDPARATLRQGSILVAERTDPGWIMLFSRAVGLLVERGSLLSHSAIVAREMGIPAIVSIPGLTQWLKNGDWVEMDGSTGMIRRLEVEPAVNLPDAVALLPAREVSEL
jgi:phosphohistidine swiveling domain-containing protein